MRGIYWSATTGSLLLRKRFVVVNGFIVVKKDVRCSEGNNENNTNLGFAATKLSFVVKKRFTTAKTPFTAAKEGSNRRCHVALSQRRTVGWNKNIPIFSPSLSHFPRPINTIIISMIRGSNFEKEYPLLGFLTPGLDLGFLDFFDFYLVFGVELEDLADRGLL